MTQQAKEQLVDRVRRLFFLSPSLSQGHLGRLAPGIVFHGTLTTSVLLQKLTHGSHYLPSLSQLQISRDVDECQISFCKLGLV
jgi:hypothetical protein